MPIWQSNHKVQTIVKEDLHQLKVRTLVPFLIKLLRKELLKMKDLKNQH